MRAPQTVSTFRAQGAPGVQPCIGWCTCAGRPRCHSAARMHAWRRATIAAKRHRDVLGGSAPVRPVLGCVEIESASLKPAHQACTRSMGRLRSKPAPAPDLGRTLQMGRSHVLLLGLGRMWGSVSPARSALHISNTPLAPLHCVAPVPIDTLWALRTPQCISCVIGTAVPVKSKMSRYDLPSSNSAHRHTVR